MKRMVDEKQLNVEEEVKYSVSLHDNSLTIYYPTDYLLYLINCEVKKTDNKWYPCAIKFDARGQDGIQSLYYTLTQSGKNCSSAINLADKSYLTIPNVKDVRNLQLMFLKLAKNDVNFAFED